MDTRLKIYRGADKTFLIRLKSSKTYDPFPLDNTTHIQVVFINADRTKLVLTNGTIPAKKAQASKDNVLFTAQEAGNLGNSIIINSNGVDTYDDLVSAWNDENPTNLVAHNAPDGSAIPSIGEINLTGGHNAYKPVEVFDDPKLGKIQVTITEKETAKLRTGNNNSFTVILDNGDKEGGFRNMGSFEQKVDIKEAIV